MEIVQSNHGWWCVIFIALSLWLLCIMYFHQKNNIAKNYLMNSKDSAETLQSIQILLSVQTLHSCLFKHSHLFRNSSLFRLSSLTDDQLLMTKWPNDRQCDQMTKSHLNLISNLSRAWLHRIPFLLYYIFRVAVMLWVHFQVVRVIGKIELNYCH